MEHGRVLLLIGICFSSPSHHRRHGPRVGGGSAVASINYRLTDAAQWPGQIDDCYSAVRWLRDHGGELFRTEAVQAVVLEFFTRQLKGKS